jgi:hypothetical protein
VAVGETYKDEARTKVLAGMDSVDALSDRAGAVFITGSNVADDVRCCYDSVVANELYGVPLVMTGQDGLSRGTLKRDNKISRSKHYVPPHGTLQAEQCVWQRLYTKVEAWRRASQVSEWMGWVDEEKGGGRGWWLVVGGLLAIALCAWQLAARQGLAWHGRIDVTVWYRTQLSSRI